MPYIFLNPDGTQKSGCYVAVLCSTGVIYAHQCAGFLTDVKEAEGFLIPLSSTAGSALSQWFWKKFHGNSYEPAAEWNGNTLLELKELVSQVVCWWTEQDEAARLFLEFDDTRLCDCTEGWVPVHTPYGPGILIFDNCD